MQRRVFSVITLGALLLAAVPTRAEFRFNVENPAVDQEASGISTLSGWVYSTTDNPVTVRAIVGGLITLSPLCCGPRLDVQARDPDAPLNTSFSLLVNYNLLAIGDHQIVFEFSATGETTLSLPARTITIVKPGARTGEAGSSFDFLSSLDTTDANVGVDPDTGEIIIAPTTAVDADSGTARDATLKLAWRRSTQAYEIVSAASGTEFAAAQQILANSCGVQGCHDGSGSVLPGAMDLRTGQAFRSLVAIKSIEMASHLRINPGDPDASYLYQKIIGGPNITGGRMPLGGAPLSDGQIETIRNWIAAGAPPPQP